MTSLKTRMLIVFVLMFVSGCGMPPLSEGKARMIFLRDVDTSNWSSEPASVKIDDKWDLDLYPEQYSWIDVDPGRILVEGAVAWPVNSGCVSQNLIKGVYEWFPINISSGETKYINVWLVAQGSMTCNADAAEKEFSTGSCRVMETAEKEAIEKVKGFGRADMELIVKDKNR